MEGNTDKVTVGQVNIKTLEFMETVVNALFHNVKAKFHLRNVITSNTNFHTGYSYCVCWERCLTPSILQYQNYEELKKTIIEAHERTKAELPEKLMFTVTITG